MGSSGGFGTATINGRRLSVAVEPLPRSQARGGELAAVRVGEGTAGFIDREPSGARPWTANGPELRRDPITRQPFIIDEGNFRRDNIGRFRTRRQAIRALARHAEAIGAEFPRRFT